MAHQRVLNWLAKLNRDYKASKASLIIKTSVVRDVNRAAVSSYERSEVRCTLKTEHRMMMKCYEKATVKEKIFFRVNTILAKETSLNGACIILLIN